MSTKIYFTIGIPGADVYPQDFYLDKSVVSVTAGTVITVTLKHLAATLITGLKINGVACTDLTVTGASTATVATPTLTAGTFDVVLSLTGYDDYTIVNAITAQVEAPAPGAFVLTAIEWGAGRTRLSWTPSAGAMSFEIWRDSESTALATITDRFFYVDTPVAGSHTYYVKAINSTGSTNSNTVAIDIGLGGIQRRAWTYFKSTMQADTDLLAYITKWKFNRTQETFTEGMLPLFVAFVDRLEPGQFMGVAKQRTDTLVIKVSGKIGSSGDNSESELLKIDEMIRNALEKSLQLDPAWFSGSFGSSVYVAMNDQVQEVNIEVRLMLPRFTAGTR